MAIRKSIEEVLVVDGTRDGWYVRSYAALESAGFSKIEAAQPLWQLQAMYRRMTIWGSLDVTLLPEGDEQTRITLVATGNVDNVYALFRSPSRAILKTFKSALEQEA